MVGRKSPNYNNELLLNIIKSDLPRSLKDWEKIADKYWKQSKESALREAADIRRHFNRKLCNR
jgi:hypothetical protein